MRAIFGYFRKRARIRLRPVNDVVLYVRGDALFAIANDITSHPLTRDDIAGTVEIDPEFLGFVFDCEHGAHEIPLRGRTDESHLFVEL